MDDARAEAAYHANRCEDNGQRDMDTGENILQPLRTFLTTVDDMHGCAKHTEKTDYAGGKENIPRIAVQQC